MIPELGHFALIIAFCFSLALVALPTLGVIRGHYQLMLSSRSLTVGMFVFSLISFIILTLSFINDDFSVSYVATNSNSLLPLFYKMSAVWGAHEGSLLLWILILAIWSLAVVCFSRQLPVDILARVLATMGFISGGFILFTLLTSNPFDRSLPMPPSDGSDLNPLLQDPGLIFHPPILYMGYVGFSVAFAFAIAALTSGRFDSAWARWTRPWTTVAWVFLTLGIALGSWWAYQELGWGGWWFWDPVENASLMPWLVGTALIHSLAVTEKRGVFKSWTLLLAICAFSLSLLGTFIVRSGVITSVHSFASDSEKGMLILWFLTIVVGGSLLLYVLRAPALKKVVTFNFLSREVSLLANNVVLSILMIVILYGTLFPVVANALNLGVYSIGEPFFVGFFVPGTVILCILMGIGPITLWKKTSPEKVMRWLAKPLVASIVLAFSIPLIIESKLSFSPFVFEPHLNLMATLTAFLGLWILLTIVVDLKSKLRNAKTLRAGLARLSKSYYGMVLAHLGVALLVCGAGFAKIYEDDHDVRMAIGEKRAINGYEFVLNEVNQIPGPNYMSEQATVSIYRNGQLLDVLKPERRSYPVRGQILKEVAIRYHLLGDLYVVFDKSVSEANEAKAWAMGFYFKPFVTWIWLGCLIMGIGGLLAALDKRYQSKSKSKPPGKKTLPSESGLEEGRA